MRPTRILAAAAASALALTLAACGSSAEPSATTPAATTPAVETAAAFPLTIEHALGTTTIDAKPERVATVNWANHEVPLALGVVPVGMAAANFGDDDGNGTLPWVEEKLTELGAETPVLFDEADGIDFEAVAETDPDVILAAYSGLTQEDYDTLSEIAPVVAYPEGPWVTSWRDMIRYNAKAIGLEAEGDALITELEQEMTATVAAHEGLEGTAAMFLTHVDTSDLSQVTFYTPKDTRAAFFEDLGLSTPASVQAASTDPDAFSGTVSAEQVDTFDDVKLIVTYGGQEIVDALEADPLLSQMPAVKAGAIVSLGSDPLGTAANPTPLAISWVLDEYVTMLADAAAKVK